MSGLSIATVLKEARRRRVFRVAGLYIVGAWVVLQVSDLAFPALGIPDASIRFVWIGLVIGLPIALIFGWRYEFSNGRIQRTRDVDNTSDLSLRRADYITLLALAAAGASVIMNQIGQISETQTPDSYPPQAKEIEQVVATEDQPSIAVLPFVNMSSDPEQEFFSDGLSEEILNLLSRIPELKVIGRTSSFAFKNKNEDLRVIGEALGVKTLLEGSVRRSGDRIRVTAQLIDASDASNIWSATYNRDLTDIFALQDDVAAAIIDALKLHVGLNPTRGRPTNVPEAYSDFLKAGIAAAEYDWKGAESFALQAIQLDPAFAEARELLAYSYWMMADSEYSVTDARKLMREQSSRALAGNPDLALAKALFRIGDAADYSLLTDIIAFDQAAIERPGDQRILNALFFVLFICGYLDEAHEIAEELVATDPLSSFTNGRLPTALFALGRIDNAFSALEVFDQLDKEQKHWFIGDANLSQGRDEIAIESFEATLSQDGYIDTHWIKELVNTGRNPAAGQSALDLAIPQIVNSAPDDISVDLARELTSWYLYFGFLDRYFELMQQEDLSKTNWTKGGEYLAQGLFVPSSGFRSHPKFIDVANTLGIVDVWEQRGPPDFCSKVDNQWVCQSSE